jgi:Ca-activated chloride channel homolog
VKIDRSDPKLTAYALGELEPEERVEFEKYLDESREAQEEIEQIQIFTSMLSDELNSQQEPELSKEQREKIQQTASEQSLDSKPKISDNVVSVDPSRWRKNLPIVTSVVAAAAVAVLASSFFKSTSRDSSRAEQTSFESPPTAASTALESKPTDSPKEGARGAVAATAPAASASALSLESGNEKPFFGGRAPGAIGKGMETPADKSAIDLNQNSPNRKTQSIVVENPFVNTDKDRKSTFPIDVETAGYSTIRNLLNQQTLPPASSVHIEEMINYFNYSYAGSTGTVPFTIHGEVSQAPWNPTHRLLSVGLKGKELGESQRKHSNLVFLVDVSGTMSEAQKLPLLKRSLKLMVPQLTVHDRIAIVAYAGTSNVVLPSTPGSEKEVILKAIDTMSSNGSTDGKRGIHLAYQEAEKHKIADGVNRVILATDGYYLAGTSNRKELETLISSKAKKGVVLTVLGFGMKSHHDATLATLADKGNGKVASLDTFQEAKKVLVHQLNGNTVTIAKEVKIQVEFDPKLVSSFRLIGYSNRVLAQANAQQGVKNTGSFGSGQTVTALYEVIPVSGVKSKADKPVAKVNLRYKLPNASASQLFSVGVVDSGNTWENSSTNFKWAATVAGFGLMLSNSAYRGTISYPDVLKWVDEAATPDPWEVRAEFKTLVQKAEKLSSQ